MRRESEAEEVLESSARSERENRKIVLITVEEKSFEGRSPRVWGAERGFQEYWD
jgi:hypothetical protein